MDENFGPPNYVTTKRRSKHPAIQYRSRKFDDAVLEFSWKGNHKSDENIVYYRCIKCFETSKRVKEETAAAGEKESCPVAHLIVRNGVIATDPDNPSTPHCCDADGKDSSAVEVRQFFNLFRHCHLFRHHLILIRPN
jgi:hypothetical protein